MRDESRSRSRCSVYCLSLVAGSSANVNDAAAETVVSAEVPTAVVGENWDDDVLDLSSHTSQFGKG